jgi:hypothetical protein
MGQNSAVGIATRYELDGRGIESRKDKVFVPVLSSSEAHKASCTMGTGSSFRGQNDRGVILTTHHHLSPKLKKE